MKEASSSLVRTQSIESQGHSVYYNPPNFLVFSIKAFPFLVQWGLACGSSWLLIRTAVLWWSPIKSPFMGKYLAVCCLFLWFCFCSICSFVLLCFYISYISKNTQYLSFPVWLISLIHSVSIHVVPFGMITFFFYIWLMFHCGMCVCVGESKRQTETESKNERIE